MRLRLLVLALGTLGWTGSLCALAALTLLLLTSGTKEPEPEQ